MQKDFYIFGKDKDLKASISTIVVHILLLLLCLYPFLKYQDPPPPQPGGIYIAFGTQEEGADDEAQGDPEAAEEPTPEEPIAANPAEVKPTTTTTTTNAESPVKTTVKPTPKPATPTTTSKDVQSENQKEADISKQKSQYGTLFGKGTGGNAGSGNAGDTKGDPNSKALESVAKGSGRIGGGLASRGVVFEPEIKDNTQKVGRIVVTVCVDASGKVISAKFTQRGSTSLDAHLIKVAENAAAKYKFSPGEIEEQCGTITMDFKVE